MIWPELQLEHLSIAVASNSWALALFALERADGFATEKSTEASGWKWCAGAAFLAGVELCLWIGLTESRLEYWPNWIRLFFSAFTTVRGVAAGAAALFWMERSVTRQNVWFALILGAALGTIFPTAAVVICGAGWLAAALAFMIKGPASSRKYRYMFGAALVMMAISESAMVDLTTVILRLPSDQPLQWGSREWVVFLLRGGAALVLCGILWIERRPNYRGALLAATGLATAVLILAWTDTRAHQTARTAAWAQAESIARTLAPEVVSLQAAPDDLARPEFGRLVARLASIEQTSPTPIHLWIWTVRDQTVAHLADSASLHAQPHAAQILPGYLFPELPNLPLRARRGQRFESGSFFVAGEHRVGLQVPVRDAAGVSVAWLQVARSLREWETNLADVRPSALVGLLYLAGLSSLFLACRSWYDSAQRLHEKTAAAVATARAKNEMAGLVSHELRTPLQVILGHLEILSHTPLPPEAGQSFTIIDGQCRQLLGLVNDTLDLCALEARSLQLRPVRFSPAELSSAVVEELRPLATARGLALQLTLAPGLPSVVEADACRFRQILTNLLANAVKYTETGSARLAVSTTSDEEPRLVFVVTDTGPGLPTAVLTRLGEAFYPGPGSSGTGLGLALVQRLCTHLGGTLKAENLEDGGASFTVSLPARCGVPDEAFFARERAATSSQRLDGLRVVLAEDNTLVRQMLVTYLRALGVDAIPATDGAAALAACREQSPHAVILDLTMPLVDGFAVARRLREEDPGKFSSVRILGLSALSIDVSDPRRAFFDRFLVKPVELSELVSVLLSCVSKSSTTPLVKPTLGELAGPPKYLLDLFAREAPAQFTALRTAVVQGDQAEVMRLAHYLQGSAYALSDEPLRAACATLRQQIETSTTMVEVRAALETIERHLHRLCC